MQKHHTEHTDTHTERCDDARTASVHADSCANNHTGCPRCCIRPPRSLPLPRVIVQSTSQISACNHYSLHANIHRPWPPTPPRRGLHVHVHSASASTRWRNIRHRGTARIRSPDAARIAHPHSPGHTTPPYCGRHHYPPSLPSPPLLPRGVSRARRRTHPRTLRPRTKDGCSPPQALAVSPRRRPA